MMDAALQLFEAIEADDIRSASELLRTSPSLANATNEYGQTAFWQASSRGRIELVQQMLNDPIASILEPHTPDCWSRDALDAAEAYGHRDIVALLEPVFEVGIYPETPLKTETLMQCMWLGVANLKDTIWYTLEPDRPSWRVVSIGLTILAATMMLALWYSDYFPKNPQRYIAQSIEERPINDAVLNTIGGNRTNYVKLEDLVELIRNDRWDDITLEKIIVAPAPGKMDRLTIRCIITLTKDTFSTQWETSVLNPSANSPQVETDFDDMVFKYRSTKIDVINYAINFCFN